MNHKIKELLSDTAVFAIGNMLSKFILFFLMPLYTSVLTVSEYGIADTLNNFVELLLPISTLCISEGVFRYLVENKYHTETIIKTGVKILFLGTSIVTVILISVNFYIKIDFFILTILLLWAQILRQFTGYTLRGLGESRKFALIGIISTVTLVIFNLLFLKFYFLGISGFLLSIIISNLLAAIISYIYIRQSIFSTEDKNIEGNLKKEMLSYSIPIVPNNISWWLNTAASRYVLLFYMGSSATGMYAAASKLPAIINMLASIFQQAWMYSASKIYQEDKKIKKDFYSLVFRSYSMLLLLSCSLTILFVPLLSKILLKGAFYNSWIYVPLLLVSATIGAFSVFFGGLYAASMDNKVLMYSTFLGSITNIILSVILVPIFGIGGATVASLFCYLTIVLMRYYDTKKLICLEFNRIKLIFCGLILILQSLLPLFELEKLLFYNLLTCFILMLAYNKEIKILYKKIELQFK